jgi:hypothetical protein
LDSSVSSPFLRITVIIPLSMEGGSFSSCMLVFGCLQPTAEGAPVYSRISCTVRT